LHGSQIQSTRQYADSCVQLKGPGVSRLATMQIIKDEGAMCKLRRLVPVVMGALSGLGIKTVRAVQAARADVIAAERIILLTGNEPYAYDKEPLILLGLLVGRVVPLPERLLLPLLSLLLLLPLPVQVRVPRQCRPLPYPPYWISWLCQDAAPARLQVAACPLFCLFW
jgi:hypothetical protein